MSAITKTTIKGGKTTYTLREAIYEPTRELPDEIAAGIGHAITRWAHLEWYLRMTAYALTRVHPRIGRVAVRADRVEGQVTMIEDLLFLRNAEVPTDLSKLRNTLRDLQPRRDAIAHGIWIRPGDRLCVQVTSGSINLGAHEPKITRRMLPRSQPVNEKFLTTLRTDIQAALDQVIQLKREVDRAMRDTST